MFNRIYFDTAKDKFSTIEAHFPLFTGKPLRFEPGTNWSYSNAGYIVLGSVIQHVSGDSYYDFVREHVFKPAGMVSTDNYSLDDDVPNLALGYTAMGVPAGALRKTNRSFLQRGASAGGGYSTVKDLLRFSQALQGHRLLSAEYTDLAMTGKVRTDEPGGAKYAFGMEEKFLNGVRIVGHSGGGPGIDSTVNMYPDLGYTVAIMTNLDDDVSLVNNRLQMELTGQELPRPIHLPAQALQTLTGKYQLAMQPQLRMSGPPSLEITADQEGLWLDLGPRGGKRRFLALSSTEFFDDATLNARLAFRKAEAGRVVSLTLTGVGPHPIEATRAP
jgi:CubicO group peptidase (beta-lactamase class C family)